VGEKATEEAGLLSQTAFGKLTLTVDRIL
jgi:hypothetical protein